MWQTIVLVLFQFYISTSIWMAAFVVLHDTQTLSITDPPTPVQVFQPTVGVTNADTKI